MQLIALTEAASVFNAPRSTLRSAANRGDLPAVKIGAQWFVYPEDVRFYLDTMPGPGRPRTSRKAAPDAPPLRSMSQLAAALGVDRTVLVTAARGGPMPAQRIGRQYVATEDDARAYLASRRTDRGPHRTATPGNPDDLLIGDLIDLHTAAAYAGLAKASVANYVKRGRIAGRKLGSRWVTTRAAIDAYLHTRQARCVPKKYRR